MCLNVSLSMYVYALYTFSTDIYLHIYLYNYFWNVYTNCSGCLFHTPSALPLQLLMKEKRETKEMKDEAEKYQKTLQELADREIQEKLFKLFHAEQDIQHAEAELKERQLELSDLVRGREEERQMIP